MMRGVLLATLLATAVACPIGTFRPDPEDPCIPAWVIGYVHLPDREQDNEWEFLDRQHKLDLAIYLSVNEGEGVDGSHFRFRIAKLGPALLPDLSARMEQAPEDSIVIACLEILDVYVMVNKSRGVTPLFLAAVRARVEKMTDPVDGRVHLGLIEQRLAKR
jgi:hypothetical protein